MRNPRNDTADRVERSPERTCVLTRTKRGKEDLIRLALGPDGAVAPDVRARAPGRGAWIAVSKSALQEAVASGKLKGALQRAFKSTAVTVPADLAELTEQALRRNALDRLGMEARSGMLISGSDKVENAARSGKVALLIHAADAAEDGRRRLDQAWRVGGGPSAPLGEGQVRGVIFPCDRTILSLALGRENVVHLALIDLAAAARVMQALARWQRFIDPDAGSQGGDSALGPGSAAEVEGIE
ncbi:DUF448 domain-containing protein [Sphingomonas sabuli]|uniref:DUF448 domain-containing protein n=1 Tax=Sphingomonas sabuli TaxID=2764186 RepID=A0A7G9L575_9SPHN|nr:DUF448 domain-containing protein [Sphingomonas sabuli]QNM83774.1 DUF448 domain-containing protein [Sphingomonas sabuli]